MDLPAKKKNNQKKQKKGRDETTSRTAENLHKTVQNREEEIHEASFRG